MTSAVQRLEHEFAERFGFVGALAAGWGRAALRLALEAAGVHGGEVLVPDFVCAQAPEAVRRAGGLPVCFPLTRELDVAPEAFRAAITAKTRAAVVVHYFGRALPAIARLAEICRERNVALIEDCALALGAAGVGEQGDLAVFSFTKSDWCYGGGLVAARSADMTQRARAVREEDFRPAAALARRYGLLRRADFAANRPQRTRAAELAGRSLERLFGLHAQGFYEAGRYDASMPEFAVRRARRMLAALDDVTARRREGVREIRKLLGSESEILFRREALLAGSGGNPKVNAEVQRGPRNAQEPNADSCAFLLVNATGRAHEWRKRAARAGVTLRLCWPAYQPSEAGRNSPDAQWLAENLLYMEIHPELNGREIRSIGDTLKSLKRQKSKKV